MQVVIEGMGRVIHSNLHTKFKCAALKLAMIKNARLAKKLFKGLVYDCVCIFEPGVSSSRRSTQAPTPVPVLPVQGYAHA